MGHAHRIRFVVGRYHYIQPGVVRRHEGGVLILSRVFLLRSPPYRGLQNLTLNKVSTGYGVLKKAIKNSGGLPRLRAHTRYGQLKCSTAESIGPE